MKTLTIDQLIAELTQLRSEYGGLPVVLWDLDTGWYYQLSKECIERQQMPDGSIRISIGLNSFDQPSEPEPLKRPL